MTFLDINEILKDVANEIVFKETTNVNDIVILITEDNMIWAVVNNIGDIKSDGKRTVLMKILSIPPMEIVLRLFDSQLYGEQSIELDIGTAFIKAVDFSLNPVGPSFEELYSNPDIIDDNYFADKIFIQGNNIKH